MTNHITYLRHAVARNKWHANFLHVYWNIPKGIGGGGTFPGNAEMEAPYLPSARPRLTPILKQMFGKDFAA